MKRPRYIYLWIIFLIVIIPFGLITSTEWINSCIAQVSSSPEAYDVLHMRNGTILMGNFAGGDAQTIKFATKLSIQSISRDQAFMIMFGVKQDTPPVGSTQKLTTAQVSPQTQNPKMITIPAGTILMVNITDQLSSKDTPGRRFSARLAVNLTAGGVVVAKTGTTVYGRVAKSAEARRLVGRSELELNLTEININGEIYPLMTTNFAEVGKDSFHKTARNVGLGALVGGVFGDSDDAKKGANIGLGLSIIRKGQSVVVPAGAVLEFRMTQPLTIAK